MKIHVRLIELQLYVPNVASQTDIGKAMGALKHHLKGLPQIAYSVAPFHEVDRVVLAFTVIGYQKLNIEQESERLLEWIDRSLEGQTLRSQQAWL